jgi:hypothetical protein
VKDHNPHHKSLFAISGGGLGSLEQAMQVEVSIHRLGGSFILCMDSPASVEAHSESKFILVGSD